MRIGEFAERTRLSVKALRLYDRLGLVEPVRVEASNGYRHYSDEQVPDAVLVGLLRRLDMPLDSIATVLSTHPQDRGARVRDYWDGVEQLAGQRRALVTYLCARLEGAPMPTHEIQLRALPCRSIVSINRHVLAGETDAFFAEAFAALRGAGPGLEGIAGCPYVIFYGEVSDDSDGPIELCRPIVAAAPRPEGLETRIEPAHEEAYVRLRKDELVWPDLRSALDELEDWARTHEREPAAPFRQVLFADQRQAAADAPVADLSIPLRSR